MADRVGFEPTSRLRDYLISSAPRYDHFDTSPGMSNTVKTLESQKILKKQNVRTAC